MWSLFLVLGCTSGSDKSSEQLMAEAQKLTYHPQVFVRTESFADGSANHYREIQLPCDESFIDYSFSPIEITTHPTDFSGTNPPRQFKIYTKYPTAPEYVLAAVILEKECMYSEMNFNPISQ